jgi:ABC-type Fe3+/spermidine/putrescine transport system ATPase subunit
MEVTFKNITKQYGSFYAVKDLNLTIQKGALHFLLGPSGCGKTTSLRMLAGLESPTSGEILFNGKDVTRKPAAERGIGMVFQNYALWPHMTVKQNIEYGLKLRKLPKAEMNQRIDEVLEITRLTGFVERLPGQLSGGQQQRVALARALAIRPNVLLLDEPLSNLDAKLRLEMRDNICRIHKQTGITTVYVTHDQKEALSMGTCVSVMYAGELIQTDSPRRLYHHPATPFIAGFIGETNLLNGEVVANIAGGYRVKTPVGEFESTAASQSFAPGDQVMVSFRPEAVDIQNGEQTVLSNRFDVQVERVTYLGELEQMLLKGGNPETLLKVNVFNASEQHAEGQKLTCGIKSKDILVLPRQTIGQGT